MQIDGRSSERRLCFVKVHTVLSGKYDGYITFIVDWTWAVVMLEFLRMGRSFQISPHLLWAPKNERLNFRKTEKKTPISLLKQLIWTAKGSHLPKLRKQNKTKQKQKQTNKQTKIFYMSLPWNLKDRSVWSICYQLCFWNHDFCDNVEFWAISWKIDILSVTA